MNVQLLVIDPQNDFCYPGIDISNMNIQEIKSIKSNVPVELINPGALFVPGADEDMKNLTAFVKKKKNKIDDIHVTLDSHHFVDIAHPIFFVDSKGNHPAPFTIITSADMESGTWRTTNPDFMDRTREYTKSLETNGRYPLCIWPPHCLIGSFGYGVVSDLFSTFKKWEEDFAIVDYVTKGSNFWTEHYSAVQADVPDPEDPGTQLNQGLIQILQDADMILLAGEARSHCLANTVRDIANNFGEDNIKKMYLLEDCTSDVTGFEGMGTDFVTEMTGRGMNLTDTSRIL
jgi:nicotinamidase-related amidase